MKYSELSDKASQTLTNILEKSQNYYYNKNMLGHICFCVVFLNSHDSCTLKNVLAISLIERALSIFPRFSYEISNISRFLIRILYPFIQSSSRFLILIIIISILVLFHLNKICLSYVLKSKKIHFTFNLHKVFFERQISVLCAKNIF